MDKIQKYIDGRACGILGLGVSNLPLAGMICRMGVPLTVRDKKTPEELGAGAIELKERGVRFVSGSECFDEIEEAVIFRSPGIRPDIAGIKNALARGACLTSEIELLLEFCLAETYGITGSDGKTTTTTLTGKFLEAESERTGRGKVYVGGNIGTPLLEFCEGMTEDDRTVLELSSFQLMTVKKAPRNIAITNITPNHIDWHGAMDEYIWAKKNIIGENTCRVVVNRDNEETRKIGEALAAEGGREVIFFSSSATSMDEAVPAGCEGALGVIIKDGYVVVGNGDSSERVLDTSLVRVPGKHNLENFMTAIGLTYRHVKNKVYERVAREFTGVPHRLEWVRELDGVDYYNSSIDSSPTRTAAALSALGDRDIVVICGGYDKKIPYEPLAKALYKYARGVVLTGATRDKIYQAIKECDDTLGRELEVRIEPDFANAVRTARTMAKKGGCVALSPASASFDAFKNFSERGDTFKRIVNEL